MLVFSGDTHAFEQGCKTALAFPRVSNNFRLAPFQNPFWPDGGIRKLARSQGKRCQNGKQIPQADKNAQPLHDPMPSCTTLFLAGIEPATVGLNGVIGVPCAEWGNGLFKCFVECAGSLSRPLSRLQPTFFDNLPRAPN